MSLRVRGWPDLLIGALSWRCDAAAVLALSGQAAARLRRRTYRGRLQHDLFLGDPLRRRQREGPGHQLCLPVRHDQRLRRADPARPGGQRDDRDQGGSGRRGPAAGHRLSLPGGGDQLCGHDGWDRPSFTTTKIPLSVQIVGTPNPVVFGSPFFLEGTLSGTGASTREVVLQANPFPYLGGFKTVGNPEVTNSVGSFSFPFLGLSKTPSCVS